MSIKKWFFFWKDFCDWLYEDLPIYYTKFYDEKLSKDFNQNCNNEHKDWEFFEKKFEKAFEDQDDWEALIFWRKGYTIIWVVFFCLFNGNYVLLFYLWAVWVI